MQYIVIEGNIGAGKTSLARLLAERHNAKLVLEHLNDNPFLPKFYDNPDRYAFQMELSFLAERYRQILDEINNRDLFQPLTIADYYMMKSLIFSRINLAKDEYRLYKQVFDMMNHNAPKPDVYVYLHTSLSNLVRNIKNRGRFYEQRIQNDYLVMIQEGYMEYFKTSVDFPILFMDVTHIDFVNTPSHLDFINEAIFSKKYHPGLNKVEISPFVKY